MQLRFTLIRQMPIDYRFYASRLQANGSRNGTSLNTDLVHGCDIVSSACTTCSSHMTHSKLRMLWNIKAPFNIAQYALLLCMVAQVTGKTAGDLVYTIGDAHIYNNHFDQVKEQLSREPYALPKLRLNQSIKNIDDFKLEDIVLEGYQCHPAIKAPVAV